MRNVLLFKKQVGSQPLAFFSQRWQTFEKRAFLSCSLTGGGLLNASANTQTKGPVCALWKHLPRAAGRGILQGKGSRLLYGCADVNGIIEMLTGCTLPTFWTCAGAGWMQSLARIFTNTRAERSLLQNMKRFLFASMTIVTLGWIWLEANGNVVKYKVPLDSIVPEKGWFVLLN